MVEMTAAVTRFCVKCGKDRQVDGDTFRCLVCGMQTKSITSPAPYPPPATAANGQQAAVVLPSTTRSRQWVEQTQALADAFAKAAKQAETKAQTATAEAGRLRRAASAFLGLLKQIDVEAPRPTATRKLTGGRWSRKFNACTKCRTTATPHRALGLCQSCYDAAKRSAGSAA